MREGETVVTSFEPQEFGIGTLFHRISDAVVVANAATERIVLWNGAAERLFGYSHAEALELPLHRLVPEDLRERHRAGIARYQDTGSGSLVETGHPVEVEGLHKDGRRIPVELSLTPIQASGEHPDRFALAIVRDASERKAAEEARALLREAELRKRQALDLHDTIVQGLASAKMAFDLDSMDKVRTIVEKTLTEAQSIVRELLLDLYPEGVAPGDLVREDPDR